MLPLDVMAMKGLTCAAKVVYAYLSYRQGKNDDCYPSVNRIAEDCGINRKTAMRATRALLEAGVIEVDIFLGRSTRYRIAVENATKQDQSVERTSPETGPHQSREGTAPVPGRDRTSPETGPESEPVREPRREPRREPSLAQSEPEESELSEFKLSSEPEKKTPKVRKRLWTTADAESLYDAYPRHVGKAAAIRAIGKALNRVATNGHASPVAWLLERVHRFAGSPAGQRATFVPYPSTWFNQGRYDDDEAEWNRHDDEPPKQLGRIQAPPGKYSKRRKHDYVDE